MTTYNFRGYKSRVEHRFTCPACSKPNRVRTFTVEHTVNPYNTNEDGTVKTASEVSRSAQAVAEAQRDRFIKEPLCATCENDLPYADRIALFSRRQALGTTDAK